MGAHVASRASQSPRTAHAHGSVFVATIASTRAAFLTHTRKEMQFDPSTRRYWTSRGLRNKAHLQATPRTSRLTCTHGSDHPHKQFRTQLSRKDSQRAIMPAYTRTTTDTLAFTPPPQKLPDFTQHSHCGDWSSSTITYSLSFWDQTRTLYALHHSSLIRRPMPTNLGPHVSSLAQSTAPTHSLRRTAETTLTNVALNSASQTSLRSTHIHKHAGSSAGLQRQPYSGQ